MCHCIVCGKTFLAKNVNSVHCSKKFSDETYRNKRRAEKRERERQAIVDNIEDKDFLTVVKVYNRYNVSRLTIYRWIRQGKVKGHNPGDRMTPIEAAEIENLL